MLSVIERWSIKKSTKEKLTGSKENLKWRSFGDLSSLLSVQFSLMIVIILVQSQVLSDSLRHSRLQHARLLCPPLSRAVCWSSCPLSQWCYLTISSSISPYSSSQSFPASRSSSEPLHHIRWPQYCSFSFSNSAFNEYSRLISFRIDWFDLEFKGLSRVFSSTTVLKHQFFTVQPSFWSNSHIHTWLLAKKIALTIWTFADKVMSLLFNMLPRFVIAFFPTSKCLLISWLKSPSAVILKPKK